MIDYNKIEKAMNEIFVGNYIFSESELNEIYNETSKLFRLIVGNRGRSINKIEYQLVFVALVNMAKDWTSGEDRFFEYIYKKLLLKECLTDSDCTAKMYNQIVKIIKTLAEENGVLCVGKSTKTYYSTLCAHSFAPKYSYESFFDMCWKIYLKDLSLQYTKHDPVYQLLADTLNNRVSGEKDDEDFKLGHEVYSFRAGIRGLATDEPKKLAVLLEDVIRIIDELFNDLPLENDRYIYRLVKEWWYKKQDTFGLDNVRRNINRGLTVNDYTLIKPKYIYEDNKIKLLIPGFRVKDYKLGSPLLEVFSNDTLIYSNKLDLDGSGILISTSQVEIEIKNMEHIKVCISQSDNIIYESRDSLYRDFILLKEKREIYSQECLPGKYYLFINDINSLLQKPNTYQKISGVENLYVVNPIEGDLIQNQNRTIFFYNERSKRDMYFYANKRDDALYRLNGKEYSIIDGELYVDVKASINLKEYGVRYEDLAFNLNDFSFTIIGENKRINISKLLNVGEPQKLNVFRYEKNSVICSMSLIKFNNINITFDKDLYYGNDSIGIVEFKTQKYNLTSMFNINDEEISLHFEPGEIILFPPVLRWKIDDCKWNTSEMKTSIWHKELKNDSILYIDAPSIKSYKVFLTSTLLEQGSEINSLKLGESITLAKQSLNIARYTLFIRVNNANGKNNVDYACCDIYTKPVFLEEPFVVFNSRKQIYWIPKNYIGDKNTEFVMDIDFNDNHIREVLTIKPKTLDYSNIEEGKYSFIVYYREEGKLIKICNHDFVFGNEKELKYKNKIIQIDSVELISQDGAYTIRPLYIDTIKYIGNGDGIDYYSGSLYLINKDNVKKYINYLYEENGSKVSINPLRIDFANDKCLYIGYGLYIDENEIEYNDEFALDSRDRLSVSLKTNGVMNKSISYYYFKLTDK